MTARPNSAKSGREVAQNAGADFGAQFKNELNKTQPKPAEKVASAKPAEHQSESKIADAREPAPNQDQARPVESGKADSADSAEAATANEADQSGAQATDANLAALLGMMHLAQTSAQTLAATIKPDSLAQAGADDAMDGKSLIASLGEQGLAAAKTKTADAGDDLLAQDQSQGQKKSNLSANELGAAQNLAANIAVDELNPVANLPLELKVALPQAENTFADTLANKLTAPANPLNAITPALHSVTPTAAAHAAANAAIPNHYLEMPVQDARWGEAVAQRVSMMLGKQEQQIEMQLNPPNLGPMEVRLNLGSEQASVIFTSQHAAVREALAAATPKLTALLADQGIVLQNVQVASDSLQQQQQNAFQQQTHHSGSPAHRASLAGEMANSNLAGVDRVVNLAELRMPVGSTRVSLFV
jgi:flagellar hook-length control protein FliK